MKGILEFTLPDEDEEFRSAASGHVYRSILLGVSNALRQKLKYMDLSDETSTTLAELRDSIHVDLDGLPL